MKKQHKTPCRECPFRRSAAPGWLGGFTPDAFRQLADMDRKMPCHIHMKADGVDYENPGGAPQCAGRAIHWANQFKTPRTRGVLLELPREPIGVFEWPHEFVAYHKAGALAEVDE